MGKLSIIFFIIFCATTALEGASFAAPPDDGPATNTSPTTAEKVNVDSIKEKYWAKGEEPEVDIVQNRLYSFAHRFELSAFGGVILSDPFLSVQNFGLELGYHFSEVWSLNALAWKSLSSYSSAFYTFESVTNGVGANTNSPMGYFGLETGASILYGKLSLLGKAIIYYDMHLLGGAGATTTGSGTYFTPSLGIGQQVFISQMFSIRVDYRLMPYYENIIQTINPFQIGQIAATRWNWSNVVTFGLSFMFGGSTK